MKRHLTHSRRRGSAVLDAALVLPVLLYLAMGCVEFGQYFYIKHTVQGAAREGARAAVTGSAMTEVDNAVASSMGAAGLANKYTVEKYTVTGVDGQGQPILVALPSITATTPVAGTSILIKVYCNWSTVGTRGMGFIGSSKQVIGTTTMRREG